MTRGVTMGFATTVLLAALVGATSYYASQRLDDGHDRVAAIDAQQLDLVRLQVEIAALAAETDPVAAADDRVELQRLEDRIEARFVELLVIDPGLADFEVTLAGGDVVPLGVAMNEAIDEVDSAASFLTQVAATVSPGFTNATVDVAVERAIASLDAVAGPLGERSVDAADDIGDTASLIRTVGLAIAVASVLAGFVRLIVVGRPMVVRLTADRDAFLTAQRRHNEEGMLRDLTARLTEGLETAESEAGVLEVVERSLRRVVAENPAELLLADSSKAHLRAVVSNPGFAAPGCGVTSPWSCPAVRRASSMHYDDSTSLRACPHLADRGELAGACVPVSFMGDAMGVLHVTGERGWTPDAVTMSALEMVAGQSAVRLGSIRSFMKAEIQANTDALTGLPNRRATEDHVGAALGRRERSSIAMADLDRFKQLNDTHGHEAGDRALRMFAEVLRESVRDDDWAGRWGGEEFVLHLPDTTAGEAKLVLERVRENLAAACRRTDVPDVTVSIGVVDSAAAQTLDELVALADDCLYVAKENGRDQVVVGP
ncbi:MAG: GGDEF domain-containing protein, partial [Actinomycetota bacterium]